MSTYGHTKDTGSTGMHESLSTHYAGHCVQWKQGCRAESCTHLPSASLALANCSCSLADDILAMIGAAALKFLACIHTHTHTHARARTHMETHSRMLTHTCTAWLATA